MSKSNAFPAPATSITVSPPFAPPPSLRLVRFPATPAWAWARLTDLADALGRSEQGVDLLAVIDSWRGCSRDEDSLPTVVDDEAPQEWDYSLGSYSYSRASDERLTGDQRQALLDSLAPAGDCSALYVPAGFVEDCLELAARGAVACTGGSGYGESYWRVYYGQGDESRYDTYDTYPPTEMRHEDECASAWSAEVAEAFLRDPDDTWIMYEDYCVGGCDDPYLVHSADALRRLNREAGWLDEDNAGWWVDLKYETLADLWREHGTLSSCGNWCRFDVTRPGCHPSFLILGRPGKTRCPFTRGFYR